MKKKTFFLILFLVICGICRPSTIDSSFIQNDPEFDIVSYECAGNNYGLAAISHIADNGPQDYKWTLFETSVQGSTSLDDVIGSGQNQGGHSNAIFLVNPEKYYFISHSVKKVANGPFEETRMAVPQYFQGITTFKLEDYVGMERAVFCDKDEILFNPLGSQGEGIYTISIERRLIGTGGFIGNFSDYQEIEWLPPYTVSVNLNDTFTNAQFPNYFIPNYEYRILFYLPMELHVQPHHYRKPLN